MIDLSSYLAGRTCKHVSGIVGGGRFQDGAFEYNPQNPNTLGIWGNYKLSFDDKGAVIQIKIERNNEGVAGLAEKLGNAVPVDKQDKKVITNIDIQAGKEEVVVNVHMRHYNNRSGRVQNEDILFHAIYRTAIKQILGAV
jgi:hypothetical protein